MGIVRCEKSDNFTTVCNELLRRDDVSIGAKGVYSYLMTLPDGWKLYKTELHKHFTNGRDAVNTAFTELCTLGYVKKDLVKGTDGKLNGWDYTVFESSALLETRKAVIPLDGEPTSIKDLPRASTNNTNSPSPHGESEENNISSNQNPLPPSTPQVPPHPPEPDEAAIIADAAKKKLHADALRLSKHLIDHVAEAKGRVLTAKTDASPIIALVKQGNSLMDVYGAIQWLCEKYKSGDDKFVPVVLSSSALKKKWDNVMEAMAKDGGTKQKEPAKHERACDVNALVAGSPEWCDYYGHPHDYLEKKRQEQKGK